MREWGGSFFGLLLFTLIDPKLPARTSQTNPDLSGKETQKTSSILQSSNPPILKFSNLLIFFP
jgi:hypothetical protein